jgi:hypothetical protein
MSDILERERMNRPNNENSIRGLKMHEDFISELKDIRNISFYQYNKYVSATYDQTNGMCNLIKEAYYAYDIPDDCKAIWIDDIERIEPSMIYDRIMADDLEGLIIVHEYSIFGDYGSHGSVGMSNHRILVSEYDHIDLYGVYGSHMAACRIDRLIHDEEYKDQIFEIYNSLNGYPCIDDEDLSNLEYDLSKEVFEDCYKSDLIDAIESKFEIDIDDYDQIVDTSLWNLLETLSERSTTYWENEYTSMYIDIDTCVESMTIEDFNQYFYKVE